MALELMATDRGEEGAELLERGWRAGSGGFGGPVEEEGTAQIRT